MESEFDFMQHDYENNSWVGLVINNKDSTFSGRCQVKVFGLMDDIQNDHIPWATPINSPIFAGNGAGSISIPKNGTFVRVQFNNGDLYAPEYTVIQNVDTELINRIKDDYEGTHVLLYDPLEELTIIYQKNSGIQIYHKESYIQIGKDTMITLSTPQGDSIIQMDNDIINVVSKNEVVISAAAKATVSADEVQVNGSQSTKIGPGPYYPAILGGELFWSMMSTLASAVDLKYPVTAGVNTGIVESMKQSVTSTNVKISI